MAEYKDNRSSLTDMELKKIVKECADYIKESQGIHAQLNKSLFSSAELVGKIDEIEKHVLKIDELTSVLGTHFTYGRLDPYLDLYTKIEKVRDNVLNSLSPLHDARILAQRPQKSRLMKYQQTAVRLADRYIGESHPRQVRMLAKKIMDAADIEIPNESSISNWIKEIRKP